MKLWIEQNFDKNFQNVRSIAHVNKVYRGNINENLPRKSI